MPAAAEMDTANKNGAALKPAIVVTGASSGIGRDIARLAAADRCFLLLLGRSPQALDELVAELAATGAQAAALPIDCSIRTPQTASSARWRTAGSIATCW